MSDSSDARRRARSGREHADDATHWPPASRSALLDGTLAVARAGTRPEASAHGSGVPLAAAGPVPGTPRQAPDLRRLLREREVLSRRQHAVVALGGQAVGGTDLGELLDLAFRSTVEALPDVTVSLVRVEDADVVLHAGTPAGGSGPLPPRLPLAELSGTTLGLALRGGVPVHVPDHRAAARTPRPLVPGCAAGSSAVVPVQCPQKVWGALVAASPSRGRIGSHDLLFLQQVATLLSAAVDRFLTEETNRQQALHDSLTGLPNRLLLRQLLAEELQSRHSCAVLLLDLDAFKDVNDALGHAVGDLVLQRVAERLSGAVPDEAVTARLGGDEFAVLLPAATTPAVQELAARISDAFAEPFTAAAVDIRLGVSAGYALAPLHGADASTLLRRADVAMHRAKAGGGTWAAYEPALDAPRLLRLKLIGDLRTAISGGDLELHYQPVVDLRTGLPCSVEALARWWHPGRGTVAPEQFISLAEQSRLIGPLTLWVLDEAVEQCRAWRAAGLPPLPVAVNWSIHCLRDPGTDAAIRRRLVEHRDLLTVEVTESALVDDEAREVLEDLAAQGVCCAIDDFGTGYASLAHLRRLPVERLKIDKTFIEHLDTEPKDRAIVRSVADLAHALGLSVTAEGVESGAVATELRLLGVGSGQGHLWSPAVPGSRVAAGWGALSVAAQGPGAGAHGAGGGVDGIPGVAPW